jgi:hypothetical protein
MHSMVAGSREVFILIRQAWVFLPGWKPADP